MSSHNQVLPHRVVLARDELPGRKSSHNRYVSLITLRHSSARLIHSRRRRLTTMMKITSPPMLFRNLQSILLVLKTRSMSHYLTSVDLGTLNRIVMHGRPQSIRGARLRMSSMRLRIKCLCKPNKRLSATSVRLQYRGICRLFWAAPWLIALQVTFWLETPQPLRRTQIAPISAAKRRKIRQLLRSLQAQRYHSLMIHLTRSLVMPCAILQLWRHPSIKWPRSPHSYSWKSKALVALRVEGMCSRLTRQGR